MIAIVFDGPPGPEAGRFVEVERDGKSIEFGKWEQIADGYWQLNLVEVARLEEQLAEAEEDAEMQHEIHIMLIEDAVSKHEAAQAELEEVKSKAWKTVDLEEGNMLVFVGVHVVAWQQSWGQPTVGFSRWNDDD